MKNRILRRMIELREQGLSYRNISKITKYPITTIFYNLSLEHREVQKDYGKKYRLLPKHKKEKHEYWQKYSLLPRRIFSILRTSAHKRNNLFSITEEVFTKWYEKQIKKCVYCNRTAEESKDFTYRRLSIDRKDNNKGYELNNLVLACYRCNVIKSNIFTYDEMLEIGKLLKKIFKKRVR